MSTLHLVLSELKKQDSPEKRVWYFFAAVRLIINGASLEEQYQKKHTVKDVLARMEADNWTSLPKLNVLASYLKILADPVVLAAIMADPPIATEIDLALAAKKLNMPQYLDQYFGASAAKIMRDKLAEKKHVAAFNRVMPFLDAKNAGVVCSLDTSLRALSWNSIFARDFPDTFIMFEPTTKLAYKNAMIVQKCVERIGPYNKDDANLKLERELLRHHELEGVIRSRVLDSWLYAVTDVAGLVELLESLPAKKATYIAYACAQDPKGLGFVKDTADFIAVFKALDKVNKKASLLIVQLMAASDKIATFSFMSDRAAVNQIIAVMKEVETAITHIESKAIQDYLSENYDREAGAAHCGAGTASPDFRTFCH